MEWHTAVFAEDGRHIFRAMQRERDWLPAVGPSARKHLAKEDEVTPAYQPFPVGSSLPRAALVRAR
jgi:hypothetical protein